MWSTPGLRRPVGRPPDLRRRPSTSPLSPSPSPSSSFICLWPSQAGYKPIKVFYHHFHHFNPFHPISSSLVSLSNVHGKPYGIFDAMALSFQDSNTIGDFKAEIVLHVYLSWNIESPWWRVFRKTSQKIFKTRLSLTHPHHLIHLSFIPRFQNFRFFYFYFYSPTLLLLDIFEVKPISLSNIFQIWAIQL